ncbi:MAG: isoamylase [Treponema sp.]|nr:isoamylase [Treponema sp.]
MKAFIMTALLIFIIGNIGAVDIESYQFISHLREISRPGKPEIFEDGVLFTASSSLQRVGISFAHENYAKVHWFQRLMVPKDPLDLLVNGRVDRRIDPYEDSGIMFHVEPIPAGLKNMDYRLIIDGLWTTDPTNPNRVLGPSGVVESRFPLPERSVTALASAAPGTYTFSYYAPSGETITVGGSFNSWDPFMYELRETIRGFYTLTLPLSPGNFQYVFFYRGEQVPDPANTRRLYRRDGRIVSEATVY